MVSSRLTIQMRKYSAPVPENVRDSARACAGGLEGRGGMERVSGMNRLVREEGGSGLESSGSNFRSRKYIADW
jgi:hypothetical protein